MSIYLVNGEMIELSVNNPTAADLKRHFGSSSEDSLVIINWPDGSQQMLADHENIPANVAYVSIVPQYTYGGSDLLVLAASVATVTQVFLMVADMWSRRTKKSKASKKQGSSSVPWDEIEHITVSMSDGNLVEFNSWRSNPNQVRSFIDVFNSQSASVKPKKVVFHTKTHSKLEVDLYELGSLQTLDKLLEFLKQ